MGARLILWVCLLGLGGGLGACHKRSNCPTYMTAKEVQERNKEMLKRDTKANQQKRKGDDKRSRR